VRLYKGCKNIRYFALDIDQILCSAPKISTLFWIFFSVFVREVVVIFNEKYQLSLTNPRDALHHGKRAANKGGRSV